MAEPLAESLGQAEQLRRHHRHPDDDGGAHDRPALRGHRVDVAEADGCERGEPEVERGEEVGDVLVHRVLRLVDATGGDEDERQERRADARQLQLVRPHVGLLDTDSQLEALERLRVLQVALQPQHSQQPQEGEVGHRRPLAAHHQHDEQRQERDEVDDGRWLDQVAGRKRARVPAQKVLDEEDNADRVLDVLEETEHLHR